MACNVEELTWSTSDLLMLTPWMLSLPVCLRRLMILGLRFEPAVIIIAACLPTLRPFYMPCTGRRDTLKNSSQKRSSRSSKYNLRSLVKGRKGTTNQRSKDTYATNTFESGEGDSTKDKILPCQDFARCTVLLSAVPHRVLWSYRGKIMKAALLNENILVEHNREHDRRR